MIPYSIPYVFETGVRISLGCVLFCYGAITFLCFYVSHVFSTVFLPCHIFPHVFSFSALKSADDEKIAWWVL